MERKKQIKKIEYHLRNYKNYKVAVKNLQKQLDLVTSMYPLYNVIPGNTKIDASSTEPTVILTNQLSQNQMIIDAIDSAISQLTDIEKQFIEFRYFNKWSIEKSAMKIGYSDKTLFVIRNQIMDKLLISLSGIILITS
jgi:RinA family phage transcriptional activator